MPSENRHGDNDGFFGYICICVVLVAVYFWLGDIEKRVRRLEHPDAAATIDCALCKPPASLKDGAPQ